MVPRPAVACCERRRVRLRLAVAWQWRRSTERRPFRKAVVNPIPSFWAMILQEGIDTYKKASRRHAVSVAKGVLYHVLTLGQCTLRLVSVGGVAGKAHVAASVGGGFGKPCEATRAHITYSILQLTDSCRGCQLFGAFFQLRKRPNTPFVV